MKIAIQLAQEFSSDVLADGVLGNSFRATRIESIWPETECFEFDLEGISNVTDSFAHALFGNLAEEHGREILSKIRFTNCSPLVASVIKGAVGEGFHRRETMGC